VFHKFIDTIRSLDIIVSEVSIEESDKIYESWRPIRLAESAEVHSKWLETRSQDYGNDVRQMLMRGTQISAINYIQAHKFRRDVRNAFVKALKDVDVLVMPTTPLTAPGFDEPNVTIGNKTIEVYAALSRNTIAFDSTGLPALSIPAGLSKDNMPVGVQIVSGPFEEEKILGVAFAYEPEYNSL
jgi:aspartyl-tRNA(Asn)/glutamyl-tRNA(Gln) amidotransferase subunit A